MKILTQHKKTKENTGFTFPLKPVKTYKLKQPLTLHHTVENSLVGQSVMLTEQAKSILANLAIKPKLNISNIEQFKAQMSSIAGRKLFPQSLIDSFAIKNSNQNCLEEIVNKLNAGLPDKAKRKVTKLLSSIGLEHYAEFDIMKGPFNLSFESVEGDNQGYDIYFGLNAGQGIWGLTAFPFDLFDYELTDVAAIIGCINYLTKNIEFSASLLAADTMGYFESPTLNGKMKSRLPSLAARIWKGDAIALDELFEIDENFIEELCDYQCCLSYENMEDSELDELSGTANAYILFSYLQESTKTWSYKDLQVIQDKELSKYLYSAYRIIKPFQRNYADILLHEVGHIDIDTCNVMQIFGDHETSFFYEFEYKVISDAHSRLVEGDDESGYKIFDLSHPHIRDFMASRIISSNILLALVNWERTPCVK